MNFQTVFSRWKRWLSKWREPPCPYESTIENMMKIDPSSMIRAFSSDMSFSKISVLGNNIEEHTVLLEKFHGYMKNEVEFDPAILPDRPTEMLIRKWFTSRQKKYLDSELCFTMFRKAAVEFLRTYKALESKQPKTFEQEKLLYLLQYFVGNLIEIEKALNYEFHIPRSRVGLPFWGKDQVR